MSWKDEFRQKARAVTGAAVEGLRRDHRHLVEFIRDLVDGTGLKAVERVVRPVGGGDAGGWTLVSVCLGDRSVEFAPEVTRGGDGIHFFVAVRSGGSLIARILRVETPGGEHRWAVCPLEPGGKEREFQYREIGEILDRCLLTGQIH